MAGKRKKKQGASTGFQVVPQDFSAAKESGSVTEGKHAKGMAGTSKVCKWTGVN